MEASLRLVEEGLGLGLVRERLVGSEPRAVPDRAKFCEAKREAEAALERRLVKALDICAERIAGASLGS